MNRMNQMKIWAFAVLLIVLQATVAHAQVGGNASPLHTSVHTYKVTMGDELNTPTWNLYPGTATVASIESGSEVAYTRGVHYRVLDEDIVGGKAIVQIQYNGTAPLSVGTYVLAYREINNKSCLKTNVLTIELQAPFDVDVELADAADAARCPDLSGTAQNSNFTTSISYRVHMVSPASPPGYEEEGAWYFRYTVTAVGQSGTAATIARIQVDDDGDAIPEFDNTPGTSASTYTSTYTVTPASIREVIVTVTYNDVLGVDQSISFELSEIEGSYRELDADVLNSNPSDNTVTHTIWSMPNVGAITALN